MTTKDLIDILRYYDDDTPIYFCSITEKQKYNYCFLTTNENNEIILVSYNHNT